MLTDVIPALWRKRMYVAYAALGFVTGAVQAGYSALNHGQPDLLTVWLAVYGFAGTFLGLTAASNVTVQPSEVGDTSGGGDA